jgi:HSP20 family protein
MKVANQEVAMKTQSIMARKISVQPRSDSSFRGEADEFIKRIEKRAYELFENRGRACGHEWEDWFKAENELFKPVNLDVTEKDGMVSIRAEVPGFKSDELEISLEPERITIKGLHQQDKEEIEEKTYLSESRSRQIFRTLQLPVSVIPEKAEAALNGGVLAIKAPRAVEAKARSQEEKKMKLAAA